jgi:TonB-linked SusC/RagA family outer membrane protein
MKKIIIGSKPRNIPIVVHRLLLTMKISILLMLIFCLQVNAETSAQTVTLNTKNKSFVEIIESVKVQTGYMVLYTSKVASLVKPIDLDVKKMPLNTFFMKLLNQQKLSFRIEDKTIFIKPLTFEELSASSTLAQEVVVKGKVTDAEGKPIPGVSVRLQTGNKSAITDTKGNYSISVPANSILIFSFIGFNTEQRTVLNQTVINLTLKEREASLTEVVVVGYGEVGRKDLTGSVAQVNILDMTKAPVPSFEHALAGRVAGVQVASNDGQPGSALNIVIRGSNSLTQDNSPLYVIDGFPVENPDNASLNQDDIESINILKDASSTAIYGARGANGVIIIETKKGKVGKSVVTYNGSVGYSNVIKQMEMMSPYEFVGFQVERSESVAKQHYFNEAEGINLESYRDIKGLNWQDMVLQTAPMQTHNMAVRGGTAGTRYSISGSIYNQEGVMIKSGFDRYQARVGLEQSISKKIKIGTNINYSHMLAVGQQASSMGTAGESSYPFFSIWGYRPVTRQFLTGDSYDYLLEELIDPDITTEANFRINPKKSIENDYRRRITKSLFANGFLNYAINKNLAYRFNAGLTTLSSKNEQFHSSQSRMGTPLFPSNIRGVNGSVVDHVRNNWLMEQTLSYKTRVRQHALDAVAGFTLQGQRNEQLGFAAQQVPNEELGISGLDEGTPYQAYSLYSNYNLASFLGRVNYGFKSTYLLTLTFRADGSSKFAPENHWSFFPSAALAWKMNEEAFLKNVDFISESKLRLSYGLTGNNRVNDFAYLATLGLPVNAAYSLGNAVPRKGVIPVLLGNKDLKWETTAQFDAGYDLGLFKNRINLTVDVYRKVTRDLLLDANLPFTSGFRSAFRNIGSVKNEGLEFTLKTQNIKNKNFSWETDFNISFNRNKVIRLVENEDNMLSNMAFGPSFSNAPLYIAKVGEPVARFYGYVWDGVYQERDFDILPGGSYKLKAGITDNGNPRGNIRPGDIRYSDINGDGQITAADRTIIGNPMPNHIGGFNNNFVYKNLSLNVLFQWSYGNEIYNANRLIFEGNALNHILLNQFASYNDRWTPENPSETLFRTGGQGPVGFHSTRVIEDGSYLRLKTLSLGYTLPSSLTKAIKVSKITLHASAQNVFTWTNYSGMDPEVSVRNSTLTPGFDYSAYPHARSIVFGINASL